MLHRASQVRRLPTLVPFRRREGARIEMATSLSARIGAIEQPSNRQRPDR